MAFRGRDARRFLLRDLQNWIVHVGVHSLVLISQAILLLVQIHDVAHRVVGDAVLVAQVTEAHPVVIVIVEQLDPLPITIP